MISPLWIEKDGREYSLSWRSTDGTEAEYTGCHVRPDRIGGGYVAVCCGAEIARGPTMADVVQTLAEDEARDGTDIVDSEVTQHPPAPGPIRTGWRYDSEYQISERAKRNS